MAVGSCGSGTRLTHPQNVLLEGMRLLVKPPGPRFPGSSVPFETPCRERASSWMPVMPPVSKWAYCGSFSLEDLGGSPQEQWGLPAL